MAITSLCLCLSVSACTGNYSGVRATAGEPHTRIFASCCPKQCNSVFSRSVTPLHVYNNSQCNQSPVPSNMSPARCMLHAKLAPHMSRSGTAMSVMTCSSAFQLHCTSSGRQRQSMAAAEHQMTPRRRDQVRIECRKVNSTRCADRTLPLAALSAHLNVILKSLFVL